LSAVETGAIGDRPALFEAARPTLMRVAVGVLRDRGLAEDAVQQAWLRFAELGAEGWPENPVGWLVRVVSNEALQIRRRRVTEQRILPDAARRLEPVRIDPETLAISADEVERLAQATGKLPVEQFLVVRMRTVDGLKFREIADQLGLPLGTVLTRMRLALERLRQELGPDDGPR
jgi:RNA polymerase sigma-70 factor (ECF subfamily)